MTTLSASFVDALLAFDTHLKNFRRSGKMIGTASCQSVHETSNGVVSFSTFSVEHPRKDLVGRSGSDYHVSQFYRFI